jgi:two-component system cell cycle sensor histidine kinase/response regulator CckA
LQHQASKPPADILRLITKNLTEMVLAYDLDRKLVFVNPAVETLTGYSMEELEKANFICWIHPDDQPRMLALWEILFQGKSFYEEEYRLVTKDGRVKWVVASWTPILDDSGRQVGIQGREFDLTRRKLAETALRHSEKQLRADEARYRALFENSPFPMWEEDFSDVRCYLDSLEAAGVSDVRGHLTQNRQAVEECVRRVRILDVNRAARDFYAASSKEELLGGLGSIFDDQAFQVFRDEIATLAENHSLFRTEFVARTLKDEERLVDMIVSIVDSAREDWSRVIVSFFDVTDRKRLEEQFVQSQKMESLGRLAGGIAHDFNNLLTVINGYSDWMLHEMEPNNPFRERLAEIHGAGERCAELTQQLLAFGRKQIARPGPLDLNRLIRESNSMLDRVIGDDIQVFTHLAPDLASIEADPSQMHQVLMNLAVNAREAMPAGGTLTIETSNLDEPPEILLEIRDTGQGMDESTRRHLFEPFFTTKKSSKNTGLGLAIVFGIVSHSGGRIEVQSRPGEGTAVRIYLPRIQTVAKEEPRIVPAEYPYRGAGVVLVVEDRREVRTLTCGMLERLGYRAMGAASGAEAVVIARQHQGPIPLLLTDVVMPGMNGREVVDQLHQIYPRMKVIFMSGYTDRILTDTGKLDPSTEYLQKPFTLNQLAEVLRRADEA